MNKHERKIADLNAKLYYEKILEFSCKAVVVNFGPDVGIAVYGSGEGPYYLHIFSLQGGKFEEHVIKLEGDTSGSMKVLSELMLKVSKEEQIA